MLLAECCYDDVNLMILGMVKRGVFGEPYYAEGSYIHDAKTNLPGMPVNASRIVDANQTLTWRGRMKAEGHGSAYPSHGIGPPAKWLGINDGDRFTYCNAMMSDPHEIHAQMVEKFGPDSKAAKIPFQMGDFVSHPDSDRQREDGPAGLQLFIHPSLFAVLSAAGDERLLRFATGLYVKGESAPYVFADYRWDSVDKFMKKYRHPWWIEGSETARKAGGHGGMDYFCLLDFVDMVRYDREPWIDCYDSATYSVLNHCSQLSIDRKGAPVEIPDFTKGKWKDPNWRKGRPGPAAAIPG